jgi:malonyl-CoA O-methyltransferase
MTLLSNMSVKKNGMHLKNAIDWVKKYRVPGSGIPVHHDTKLITPEVTGYLIPSLYDSGEKEMALDLAGWEMTVQQVDGSFLGPDGIPYTFDTAQVMRGFLKVVDEFPQVEDNLRRAADYVFNQIDAKGEIQTPSYNAWKQSDGTMFSRYCNLYTLKPLIDAGKYFNDPRYERAAQRAMDYFKTKTDLTDFKPQLGTLSHIFGYMMEALAELNEIELARKGLSQAADMQRKDGSIPAYPGVKWVCATGVSQLALAWYRMGDFEPAEKAFNYLLKIQNPSGGFYGSYGLNGKYFPKKEISWAVKFFIDAYHWHIRSMFEDKISILNDINEEDGRVEEICSYLREVKGGRIADIGCGMGRFLRVIEKQFPDTELHGMDISANYLRHCPSRAKVKLGSILNIPYPKNYFDGVFCVEALEHAVMIKNAICELVRILKPGGRLVIIDKNKNKLGMMKLLSFEQWFHPEELQEMLLKNNVQAEFSYIQGGKYSKNDELFVSWKGIKEKENGS